MIRDIVNEIGPHFHHKGVKTTGVSFKLLTRITVRNKNGVKPGSSKYH